MISEPSKDMTQPRVTHNKRCAKLSKILPQKHQPVNNFKRLMLSAVFLLLIVCLIDPFASQSTEAKKVKEKKILKQLVKSLILKNLSTKKNFVPMPVPIPGKWQQILNAIIDSGLLFGGGSTKLQHKKLNVNGGGGGEGGSGISRLVTSSGSSKHSNIDRLLASQNRLNTIKKYTRVAAAKYANKIMSNQASTHKVKQHGNRLSLSTNSGKNLVSQAVSNGLVDRKSSPSSSSTAAKQQKNDVLVTIFNLVKLAQQLRELDRSKLLNVTKKSIFSPYKMPPSTMLSMNINNRKSFMNELNYIHKLTTDFNHRHRLSHNTLFS